MPWPIRYHERRPDRPRVGDCWPAVELIEGEHRDEYRESFLAPLYFEQHYGRRAPLYVVLPDKSYFCVDSRVTDGGRVGDHGWTVTGSPHDGTLSVSPSINIVGSYHGFISNGEIGDDVEGRKFPFADLPDPPVEEPPFWKLRKE